MLIDYFQVIASGRRFFIRSRWDKPVGIEILMIMAIFAVLVEFPVFFKIIAGAQGPQP